MEITNCTAQVKDWRWFFITILCCSWLGCDGGEIDRRDELGLEDDGKYELVLLEKEDDEGEIGMEKVEKGQIQPGEPDSSAPIVYDPQGEFTVQIGVYKNSQTASQIVSELRAEGYPAYTAALPEKKAVRVRIGYFRTKLDARRFGAILKQDRALNFWVDHKSNEKF